MIRLRRTRQKKLPAGCIVVTRPTRWANLYDWQELGRAEAVRLFRVALELLRTLEPAAYMAYLAPLRGAEALACYCPPDEPCHADVLIAALAAPDLGASAA